MEIVMILLLAAVAAMAVILLLRQSAQQRRGEVMEQQVEELRQLEKHRLPPDMEYSHIQGLRLEAREKLAAVRPLDLGQASRISGVSPADIAALMIWLHTRTERGDAT